MINTAALDFKKLNGLLPCVVQDATTQKVLMLGFMNEEALAHTIKSKRVTFFSRSKQRLWTKGETSSNYLNLVDIKADCDADTLLITANPQGPACHTGADTCFNEKNTVAGLEFLEQIITHRKANPKAGSYTNSLFDSGINKIAQKVGEEAVELVIEAKDNNRNLFIGEAADLMYHYLVLLAAKDVPLKDVIALLQERHNKK